MNRLARACPHLARAALLIAAAGGLALAPQAFAERADKEKPAVINADTGSDDQLNQTQIYTGNVVLTKGTIILRADQLTTRQDPEGYNFGVAVATQPGKLAYFKQKREGVDEYMEGQAERIEYDEKSDMVKLFNRAIVKRLAAGRDADEIRGDQIDYNMRSEFSTARSKAGPTVAGAGDARVRVVMQPRIKPGSAGAGASPVQPGNAPPIELKKDTTLEGAPRS